jgi:hypothetical protein
MRILGEYETLRKEENVIEFREQNMRRGNQWGDKFI